MNIIKIFFLFVFMPTTMVYSTQKEKPMKILMVVASFPTIHNICLMNQATTEL